jgi:hypothetical protein
VAASRVILKPGLCRVGPRALCWDHGRWVQLVGGPVLNKLPPGLPDLGRGGWHGSHFLWGDCLLVCADGPKGAVAGAPTQQAQQRDLFFRPLYMGCGVRSTAARALLCAFHHPSPSRRWPFFGSGNGAGFATTSVSGTRSPPSTPSCAPSLVVSPLLDGMSPDEISKTQSSLAGTVGAAERCRRGRGQRSNYSGRGNRRCHGRKKAWQSDTMPSVAGTLPSAAHRATHERRTGT